VFCTPASHLDGPGSTLSQENVYHETYFAVFLTPSEQILENLLWLHPFKFFPIHYLETLHYSMPHKEAGAEMLLNNPRSNQMIM
jgi:hypothetical protein